MAAREIDSRWVLTIGSDPEIFVGKHLQRRFAVKESRVIIPPDGLIVDHPNHYNQGIVRDGVQVELHVGGSAGPNMGGYSCRQALAGTIHQHLSVLRRTVEQFNGDPKRKRSLKPLSISFKQLITLTPLDRKTMDADSLQLSCRESLNAYGREHILRDGATYPIRSASGHLHLGSKLYKEVDPNMATRFLDALVGVVGVLIARDPGEALRRETYGRAGEYRLPKHGLEYRTPSNYWLGDYKLMSLVFGQAKLAHRVTGGLIPRSRARWAADLLQEGISKAGGWDIVEQAINTNDRDLALRIYMTGLKPFLKQVTSWTGLGHDTLSEFEYFVETVWKDGLQRWMGSLTDKAILDRWTTRYDRSVGWERFLTDIVRPALRSASFTGIVLTPAAKAERPSRRRSGTVARVEAGLARAA